MPATSDHRALATVLAAADDDTLADLFEVRGVSPTTTWRDLFDAAEGMLEPAAVARALAALPAPEARALSRAVADGYPIDADHRARLATRALADAEGRPFAAVVSAVAALPAVPGSARADPAPADPAPSGSARPGHAVHDRPASPGADAAAAERAFTSTASLADILVRSLDAPLTRIGSGGLGAGDRRELVESGTVDVPETADLLVAFAETTGLLVADDRVWLVSDDGRTWMPGSTTDRWAFVGERFRDALPEGLRAENGGWIPADEWSLAYPYDATWPPRAAQWRQWAVAWGILTADGRETAWSAPLAAGGEPDLVALAAALPPEVDRVYLQNDLTAIAPGPLSPHLDLRLRSMARRESRAQASSYRFSADTVGAALTAGETAESIRAFLSSLSLTGLPQPLAYMIDRIADRHGLVRVGIDATTGRAVVSSEDRTALDTIAVDQALRPVGLVRDGDTLASRASTEAVFWALADARYPVVAVDAAGEVRTLRRGRVAPAAVPPQPRYAELITRLRAADAGGDGDAAWLERELDQAVRARAVIDVVVRLPDGATRTFRLEATGLGGGRLRGRDRAADVERTLPLTSVVSVHPIG